MRNLLLLLIALSIAACSKDEFDSSAPKKGQKAELFVDHYSDVRNQMIFLSPQKTISPLPLSGFSERELGYTYTVKAVVDVNDVPVMDDGVNSWFKYTGVISKERYTRQDPFEIGLVYRIGFGGSGGNLAITKEGTQFLYGAVGTLRPANEQIRQQLEEYLSKEKLITNSVDYQQYQLYLSKLDLKAIVIHDPENYGKGYLLQEIRYNNVPL